MKQTQRGFTLIELVVVIVLLGILGVTALGKFQNLSGDAATAAQDGIASEITASSAVNFAASTLGAASAVAIITADCSDGSGGPGAVLDSLMASGSAPSADLTYAIAAGGDITTEDASCGAVGDTFNCSIDHGKSSAAASIASITCTGAGP